MARAKDQQWAYVRSSTKIKLLLWFCVILGLGGGLNMVVTLEKGELYKGIFASTVGLLTGTASLLAAIKPPIKYNRHRVLVGVLPGLVKTFYWSDLIEIVFDKDHRTDRIDFGQNQSLKTINFFYYTSRVFSEKKRLYREADVLKLTEFAQQKLEKNNA